MDEPRQAYRYTVQGSGQWCVLPSLKQLLEVLEADIEAMEGDGETFTVEKSDLTPEQIEALPDFEGF